MAPPVPAKRHNCETKRRLLLELAVHHESKYATRRHSPGSGRQHRAKVEKADPEAMLLTTPDVVERPWSRRRREKAHTRNILQRKTRIGLSRDNPRSGARFMRIYRENGEGRTAT